MSRKVSLWSLSVLLVVAFAGCNDSPTEPDNGTVELRAVLSQSNVRPAEQLDWELILTNSTPRTVRLDFASGCLHNFEVSRGAALIWSLESVLFCPQGVTFLELRPGESRRSSGSWDGRDLNGNAVAPGEYQARGQILTNPRISSPPVPFRVQS